MNFRRDRAAPFETSPQKVNASEAYAWRSDNIPEQAKTPLVDARAPQRRGITLLAERPFEQIQPHPDRGEAHGVAVDDGASRRTTGRRSPATADSGDR